MVKMVTLQVFFIDGTHLAFEYPQQAGDDVVTVAGAVKKALEMERLVLEVEGDLLIIGGRNVKYVRLSPAPEVLPEGRIIRNARLIG